MMISSNTSSNWVTSCRFAPVTTSDNGTPRPSTSRCLLLPFFFPVRWVRANGFLSKRCFGHGPVDTLPTPGYTLHFIIPGKSRAPEGNKESSFHPAHEMSMNGAGAAKSLFRQGFPLAASSEDKQNRFKDLSWRHRLSATADFTDILFTRITFRLRNQRFYLLPKRIGYFPRLNFSHNTPKKYGYS